MNRSAWKQTYRRDRATVRLIREFKEVTGDYPTLWDGLSRQFDICRLHGDRLYSPYHFGLVTHKNRMADLTKRVRLPA